MKRLVKRLLFKVSGNAPLQRMIERGVDLSQQLMGIGTGSSPDSSGEDAIIPMLERRYAVTKRPLCIFDVGANKGQFLDMVMGTFHTDIPFTVHAFEPGRHTNDILRDNAKKYSNVVINDFGLGKQPGDTDLFYDQAGSGLASLYQRKLDHVGIDMNRSEKVRIETLDDYCESRKLGHVDLLKLDVEGHELDVLLGGSRMFRDSAIGMVSFEFGGCNIDSRTYFHDFWTFFARHRMGRIFRILPSGDLVPLPRYKETYEQFRTTNFLALHDDVQE